MKFKCPNGCMVDSDTPFYYDEDYYGPDEKFVGEILSYRDATPSEKFVDGTMGVPEDYRAIIMESDMVPSCLKCHCYVERDDSCQTKMIDKNNNPLKRETEMTKIKTRYLHIMWDDVEPALLGPYPNDKTRDEAAITFINEEDDPEERSHGVTLLNIYDDGTASVDSYSGGFTWGIEGFEMSYDEEGNDNSGPDEDNEK